MDIIQGYLGIIEKLNASPVGFLFENKIAYSIIIFIAFLVLSKLVNFVMNTVIPRFTIKTKTRVDDLIIKKIQKPGSYLVLLLGIYIALIPLAIPEKIISVTDNIILSLCIVLFSIIGMRIIDVFIDVWGLEWAKKTASSIDDALLPLFHKTSKVLFLVFCLVFILKVWSFNVGGLLAGVGIAGMVLGLALKDSLANIFGGISLVLDKSIKVGDKVKLGSGELGVIQDIGLRSTKLKTYDNELITIPNGRLSESLIINYVQPNEAHRAVINFSVEYGSDTEKVKKLVLKAIQNIENAVYEPEPVVVFKEMADSGLNFTALIWSTWQKSYSVKLEATKRIYNALNKAKIGIPFPTRTVYMHQVRKRK